MVGALLGGIVTVGLLFAVLGHWTVGVPVVLGAAVGAIFGDRGIREARSLARLSDSEVLVVEPRTGRAHHLTTSGAFVRTIDLGGEVESRVVRDSNGILYTRPEHLASWEPDGPVGRVPLLTVSPGRRVAAPLSVEPVGAGSVEARHPVQSPGTIRYRLDGVPVDSLDLGWREPATDFVRLSADGTVDARVAGPPGIRVLCVQGDTVLARRVGELGVHSLVRYEIDWDSTIPKQ